MRIVFMGTPEFSVPTFNALIECGYNVVATYTQPPRPKGRGHNLQKSPIHMAAERHNIPVYTPLTLRNEDEQKQFHSLNADLGIVIAYGQLLPKPILDLPFGCLNVHASILPRWRGAAPIHRAILEGDKETGITIMKMDEGLDTGPTLSFKRIPISATNTTCQLYDQLSHLGANLLIETLPGYIEGTICGVPQPNAGVTYANKIQKNEGKINWRTMSAMQIERMVRALSPSPGAWFEFNNERIKLISIQVLDKELGEPGKCIIEKSSCIISCVSGAIQINTLQRENSKSVDIADFLRGHPLFFSSIDVSEK